MTRIGAILITCLAAGSAVAQPTLGVGVLCSYALVVGLNSYQEACQPARAEEAAFLEPLIAKHRWYIGENDSWDDARYAAFEAEQRAATSDCDREDLARMLDTILAEPERLTKTLEFQLSKGQKPEWGVCF